MATTQDLTRKILELEADHGFVLPKGLTCTLKHRRAQPSVLAETTKICNGVEYWWFMKELDANNHNTPFPLKWAEQLCALELLKAVQARRPVLSTTIDGDWQMEINLGVSSPAIHWDRMPAEMIINAVYSYCLKGGKLVYHT